MVKDSEKKQRKGLGPEQLIAKTREEIENGLKLIHVESRNVEAIKSKEIPLQQCMFEHPYSSFSYSKLMTSANTISSPNMKNEPLVLQKKRKVAFGSRSVDLNQRSTKLSWSHLMYPDFNGSQKSFMHTSLSNFEGCSSFADLDEF
jgi:hypothetical protein